MAKNDMIMVLAIGAAALLGVGYLKARYGGAADSATTAIDAYRDAKDSVTRVISDPAGTGQAVAESFFGAGVNAAAWYLNYQQGFVQGMASVAQDTARSTYDKLLGSIGNVPAAVPIGGGGGGARTVSAGSSVSYESLKAASDSIQSSYPTGSLAHLPIASGMLISDMMKKAAGGSLRGINVSGVTSQSQAASMGLGLAPLAVNANPKPSGTTLVSSGGSIRDKGYGVTAGGIRYDTKVKELR